MRKITSIVLAASMVLGINIPASAASTSIQEVLSGDNIKVSGTLSAARKKQVTIQVLNPGREISELYGNAPASFKDVVAYQGQTESNEKGEFTFEFVIKGDPDKYKYFVTSVGFEVEDEIDYYGSGYVDTKIEEINDSRADKDAVEALINDNYEKINIDAPLYEKMKVEQPDKLSEVIAIFQNYPDAKDSADLSLQLNKATAVYYVNVADSAEKMDSAVCTFGAELGISELSAYKVYNVFFKEKEYKSIMSKVLSNLIAERTFETDKAFAEVFQKVVIVDTFNNVDTWSEMKELLEITNAETKIDLDKSKDLSYPEKVYLKLIDKSINKVSDIKEMFDAAVKACKAEENPSKPSGGGSGGSGGFGGGSSSPSSYAPNNIQSVSLDFADLDGYDWAKEDIYFLKDKKIISGKSEAIFDPGASITREEFVKLLVLVADLGIEKNVADFSDVEKGSWYEEYVGAAVSAGIVNGLGDGRFGVSMAIKREDMAVMTQRLLKVSGISLDKTTDVNFADADGISDYAFDAVLKLAQSGVLLGNDEGSFEPGENVTRAQAAVLLRRVYNLIHKEA